MRYDSSDTVRKKLAAAEHANYLSMFTLHGHLVSGHSLVVKRTHGAVLAQTPLYPCRFKPSHQRIAAINLDISDLSVESI